MFSKFEGGEDYGDGNGRHLKEGGLWTGKGGSEKRIFRGEMVRREGADGDQLCQKGGRRRSFDPKKVVGICDR